MGPQGPSGKAGPEGLRGIPGPVVSLLCSETCPVWNYVIQTLVNQSHIVIEFLVLLLFFVQYKPNDVIVFSLFSG